MTTVKFLRLLSVGLLSICFAILPVSAQDSKIFDYLKLGDVEKIKAAHASKPFDLTVRNSSGYTPLHWLIKYYIDYNLARYYEDQEAHLKHIEQSDDFRNCLIWLLQQGADPYARTPDGYNALQYAVVLGKRAPASMLMDRGVDKSVRDPAGNTLLHLSTLADNDTTVEHFWQLMFDVVLSDKINLNTPNYANQTPIVYYFSVPRKETVNSVNLIKKLQSPTALRAKDIYGKNAVDYAEQHNAWASFSMSYYLESADMIQKEWDEVHRKFQAQVEENNRLIKEYEQRQLEEGGAKMLTASFTQTYYYECNLNYQGKLYGSRLEEPITITVTPDDVYVSSLDPYYGRFTVQSSGYELVDGQQWEIYYFEQSSQNTTYLAIGFPVNIGHQRVMFQTNIGFEGLCVY